MPAPLAAAALVPVAAEAAKIAKQRVIGWERTVTTSKKGKVIVDRSAVEVQAWELAVAAGIGILVLSGIGAAKQASVTGTDVVPDWFRWFPLVGPIASLF